MGINPKVTPQSGVILRRFLPKDLPILLLSSFLLLLVAVDSPAKEKRSSPVKRHWVVRFAKNSYFNTKPFQFSIPVVEGNLLFAGANRGFFYAVDIKQGKKAWTYKTLGPVHSKPAVGETLVYFGDAKGNIYALDKANGKRIWTSQLDGAILSAPLLHNGKVYFVTLSKKLAAFDTATGKELWQTFPLGEEAGFTAYGSSDPILYEDQIWVGFSDGAFVAFSPATGNIGHVMQLGNINQEMHDIDATAVTWGESLYVPTADGHFFAIDMQQKKIAWEVAVGSTNDPVLFDNKIYLATNNTVYCLDRATGAILWEQNLESRGLSTPVVTDRWVTVIASKGKLYFINRQSGDVHYSTHLRGGGSYSDPVFSDNQYFILTNSARLYAFRLKVLK